MTTVMSYVARALWPGANTAENHAESTTSWSFDSLQPPAQTPATMGVMNVTGESSDDSNSDNSIELLTMGPKYGFVTPTAPAAKTPGHLAQLKSSEARCRSRERHQNGSLAGRKRDASTLWGGGEDDGMDSKRRKDGNEGHVKEGTSINTFWDGNRKQSKQLESSSVPVPGRSQVSGRSGGIWSGSNSSSGGANEHKTKPTMTAPTKIIAPRAPRPQSTARTPNVSTNQAKATTPQGKLEAAPAIKRESAIPQRPSTKMPSATAPGQYTNSAGSSRACPFLVDDDDDDDDDNNDYDDDGYETDAVPIEMQPPESPTLSSVKMPPAQLQIHGPTLEERAAQQARSALRRHESLQKKHGMRAESVAVGVQPQSVVNHEPASERPRCAGSVPPGSTNRVRQSEKTSTAMESKVTKSNGQTPYNNKPAEQSRTKPAATEPHPTSLTRAPSKDARAEFTAGQRAPPGRTTGNNTGMNPLGVLEPLSMIPSQSVSSGDGTAFDPYAVPQRSIVSSQVPPTDSFQSLTSIEKRATSGYPTAADPNGRLQPLTPAAVVAKHKVHEIAKATPPRVQPSAANQQMEVPKAKIISAAGQQRKNDLIEQIRANREDAEKKELERKDAERQAEIARRESAANARRAADARREQEVREKEDKKRREEVRQWQEEQKAWDIACSHAANAQNLARQEADGATERQKSLSILSTLPPQRPTNEIVQQRRAKPPATSANARTVNSLQSTKTTYDARREERIQASKERNKRREEADDDDGELTVEAEVTSPLMPTLRPLSSTVAKAHAKSESVLAAPGSQTGPVSLNSTAGQARIYQSKHREDNIILPADLELLDRRESGAYWSSLIKASSSPTMYGRSRSEDWLRKRFRSLQDAIKTAGGVSRTLLERGRQGDQAALDELSRKLNLHGSRAEAPKSSVSSARSSALRTIEDSFKAYPPSSPNLSSNLRSNWDADHADDVCDASNRPTTSGKSYDKSLSYYLTLMQDIYEQQTEHARRLRQPSPLTAHDYVHWAYNVLRREIHAEEMEEGVDIEDKEWVFCDEEFECMEEANAAAGAAVTRFIDRSFPRPDLSKGSTLENVYDDEGMQASAMVLNAGGAVQTQVTRYVRTYDDGILPTTKEDWVPRKLCFVYLRTIVKNSSHDLFTQATEKDSLEVLENTGYTSLQLANEAAAKHFVDLTFRPTTIHLNRRDEQIRKQVEEHLAGLDVEKCEMFRKEAEEKGGAVKRVVYVQMGNLVGPRN